MVLDSGGVRLSPRLSHRLWRPLCFTYSRTHTSSISICLFSSLTISLSNPKGLLKIGNAGDVGDVEMQDLLFTTRGATAGLILAEWNIQAKPRALDLPVCGTATPVSKVP
jgi:hypothetical protein